MAYCVDAQGEVTSAKKTRKHSPIMKSSTENSKPKTKKCFLNLN